MVHNPIHELPVDEAWALLASSDVGRIALSVGGQPDIFPINYFAGDGRVLMRTAEGTKLAELAVNGKVAFEADAYNDDGGWSVVVKGSARILSTGAEIAKADEAPLRPLIPTLKYNYIEIVPDEVSARRFEFGPEPERYPV
ncbi:pyridoxamine 5'-phosphate oxidase [Gordonia sp. 852002-50816_SCH5313054-c]|uniref:pyridoxamine 5'-phosphate oxidase family protein n=1 Tax=Gordonia TaxID=2053 RepID=UPI0007EB00F6|nr:MULTISPECIES: pyridoxamine 5'-phosphate oxidase family protein [unclassified Gordonia (in: high G+C Gram-positive bacteria)]OBC16046.1 pyridoxamine 5'-phosphate oxidase [Gordonia sp. 852002-50816_SCH5313054-c]OBC17227.1 pyridoxamine 5'-phosphate oxidase [Gordonia sp. 852002-50816_SCH5313054-a]